MFVVSKRMEVSSSHCLELDYPSKCKNTHGHNWIIDVTMTAGHLNDAGMVMDFTRIKEIVEQLDHKHLNDVLEINPTAENIALWVAAKINQWIAEVPGRDENLKVDQVTVTESEGNVACYIP